MFVCWALKGDKAKGRGVPSRVFALEPVHQNLLVMEHNLKHHDVASKVRLILRYTSLQATPHDGASDGIRGQQGETYTVSHLVANYFT